MPKKLVEKDWKALPGATNDKSVCYNLMFERGEPSSGVSSFELLCTKITYRTNLEIERVHIRCINTKGKTCIHYHFHQSFSEVFGRNTTSWQVFGTGKWHRSRWNGLCSAGSRGVTARDLEPAVLGKLMKLDNGNH